MIHSTGPLRPVVEALQQGHGRVADRVDAALETTASLESEVQAWACLDPVGARHQAVALDAIPPSLRSAHGLFGLTVGLKDIIDTQDLPTELGTVLHAGRQPKADAGVVRKLRSAGAVILGKTITTELATYAAGPTRNPWNLAHSPGGSSSGSAAAVACGMVDLAIGSQTNGSTIRPASYCGVVGFKPSRERLDREGVLCQSPSFDAVGLFARTVEDIRLLFEAIADANAVAATDLAVPKVLQVPQSPIEAPVASIEHGKAGRNRYGAVHVQKAVDRTHTDLSMARCRWWAPPCMDRMAPDVLLHWQQWSTQRALVPLTDDHWTRWQDVVELHRRIMEAEIARAFSSEYKRGRSSLSASLRGQIERGSADSDAELEGARDQLGALWDSVDRGWPDDVDFLMLPSSTGAAPRFEQGTGDPIFCTWASALDLAAISLPCHGPRSFGNKVSKDDLPLGLQIVARRSWDGQLLTLAAQLEAGLVRL